MQTEEQINVSSIDALASHGLGKAVVAIGVFDGVHIGHRRLLDELLGMSRDEDAAPVAITFHPHPKSLLQPESPPLLLIPPEVKTNLLHNYGVKAVVTISFTRDFASLSPEAFLEDCLYSPRLALKGICVGSKWRFGSGGSGGIGMLKEYADKGHFAFSAVDELKLDGMPVSSSSIRRAVSAGDLQLAARMLGRDYSLYGHVEAGFHIAGSILSSPTANLRIQDAILPPNGVYAGLARFDGRELPAAVAIGVSPTFHVQEGLRPRVEIHIIGFSGDLYGKPVEAALIRNIREERCFPDSASLKAQIESDIKQTLAILKEEKACPTDSANTL